MVASFSARLHKRGFQIVAPCDWPAIDRNNVVYFNDLARPAAQYIRRLLASEPSLNLKFPGEPSYQAEGSRRHDIVIELRSNLVVAGGPDGE